MQIAELFIDERYARITLPDENFDPAGPGGHVCQSKGYKRRK